MLRKIIFLFSISLFLACCMQDKFNPTRDINVITREQGSGTRGAFMDIFKLELKGKNLKKDLITKQASVENNTNTIIQTVKNDKHAIGYVSLGSANKDIKILKVDNIYPDIENVQNGKYTVVRNFSVIVNKSEHNNPLFNHFISFIFSNQGQEIIKKNSYIPIPNQFFSNYPTQKVKGKLIIGGSSSVSPLMEKIIEEYCKVNKDVKIELQISDSTIGITKTAEKVYNLGLASRSLKDEEKTNLEEIKIALDPIVLIVNKENTTESLTKNEIKNIYLGNIKKWIEVTKK